MIKLRIYVMSFLSDLEITGYQSGINTTEANFIKYLLIKYPNTDTEIDQNKEWEAYNKLVVDRW